MSIESFLMGSGAKSATFPTIGTVVGGVIVDEPTMQQQKDMTSGAPKFWDNNPDQPMMQLVIKVQTDERDPADADDDGTRAIYVDSKGKKDAIRDALKKVGAKAPAVGGTLKLAYTGDGTPSQKGFTPPKQYAAQYEPPAAGAAASASFFGTDKTDTAQAPF